MELTATSQEFYRFFFVSYTNFAEDFMKIPSLIFP